MVRIDSSNDTLDIAKQLLAAHRSDSEPHQRGLEMLMRLAGSSGAVEAKWLLGAYFLQVPLRVDAHEQAAHWLEEAARFGVAQAIDRLADLSLRGVGAHRSVERARGLQRMLADCGYQQSAWQYGYLLGAPTHGDGGREPAAAASAFARACALGYPPAYYSLGLRYALGAGVERDPAFARALLLRAGDGQFPDARAAADRLAPEADAGADTRTWYQRLRENLHTADGLRQQLRPDRVPADGSVNPAVLALERHFAAVAHPSLTLDSERRLAVTTGNDQAYRARPQPWQWRTQTPRLGRSTDFATREECAHLVHMIGGRLSRPEHYCIATSSNAAAELLNFNGQGSPINAMQTDAVMRELEQRIAAIAEWPEEAMEPCSIIRYRPGEEYRPHVDFFTPEQIEQNRRDHLDFGGQRLATFLLYLAVPEQGGETYYHQPGLAVAGEIGSGILHSNVRADGSPDPDSLHSGRPVIKGEKWLWRSALREFNIYRGAGGSDGIERRQSTREM